MTTPTIDELLRASAPRDVNDEPGMRERVATAVSEAPRPPRARRRPWVVLPIAAFGIAALTAGAVVVDTVMTLDVEIPIDYVTDTGRSVQCTVTVGGATLLDPKGLAIADWYRTHDWTGIGQSVYQRALEIDPAEGLDSDTPFSQDELDHYAVNLALTELVSYAVPQELLGSEASVGWQHDCDLVLH